MYDSKKQYAHKIYILGSVASGKTTLAKKLSKKHKITHYELDNVVHESGKNKNRKRTPPEIEHIFAKIVNSEKWIIEGVFRECFNKGFEKADLIILLDTHRSVRKFRIVKRWVFQNLKIEKCNYRPNVKMLIAMFAWSRNYDDKKEKLIEFLKPYSGKLMVTDNSKNVL